MNTIFTCQAAVLTMQLNLVARLVKPPYKYAYH